MPEVLGAARAISRYWILAPGLSVAPVLPCILEHSGVGWRAVMSPAMGYDGRLLEIAVGLQGITAFAR
ncbi:hypothetical protein PG997_011598 [Apiospora hydei]|uniref:Uncharacterized protein n=1 Tax=Apiospora hydei TaxID=1337664 RepID=A0ABR1VJH5_9PEZI